MSWRLANSLVRLRDQVNAAYPNRSKASDGTIGDTAHAASASDHNPNAAGVVNAMDLTNDPANGFDVHALAERLRVNRHPNLRYIISNKRIASAGTGWNWIPYTGSNPHSKHAHFSVGNPTTSVGDGKSTSNYDNAADWNIGGGSAPAPAPAPSQPNVIGIAAVVANAVNVRTQPTSQSAQGGSKLLTKGQTFEYVAAVVGENVGGNNIWLKSKYGNYVWSGATNYNKGTAAPAPAPAPAPTLRTARTTGVANVRTAPRVNAPLGGSRQLKAGVTFRYVAKVVGDSVSGNNIWYKSEFGNYVWSGNVTG